MTEFFVCRNEYPEFDDGQLSNILHRDPDRVKFRKTRLGTEKNEGAYSYT